MSIKNLLSEHGIRRALIVDDACDPTPTANDIDPSNDAWPIFNDDLSEDHWQKIVDIYPYAEGRRFDELIADDGFVATIWKLRDELGSICEPIFASYIDDQKSDQKYIDLAEKKLSSLGLECNTCGRNFQELAQTADLILIDLFFDKTQDDHSLGESKSKLRQAVDARRDAPPLVILMSRSHRLELKKEEFRDEVGLLDSAFRIVNKTDLDSTDYLERQLKRLTESARDSQKLASFFYSLEKGMNDATNRTLELLRRLRLSDIGQIQQLLLDAEGEPTGSYLVDIFDRVLQHEIERDSGIIQSAVALNQFSAVCHPSPYVAGSPELQELVERLLTQNKERLALPGALDSPVAFGDILKIPADADIESLQKALLVDLTTENVLLILTPACDLQRCGVPRVLLLVGTAKPLSVQDWSYKDDARTPAIRLGDELKWIKWNLKHIDTVSYKQLQRVIGAKDLIVTARLREAHALELQQQVLSGLGRVGTIAALPATFPVLVEIYYPNIDSAPTRLDVPALEEGAVCFVGRDSEGKPVLRLIMTDDCCDSVIDAYSTIQKEHIPPKTKPLLDHLQTSDDLRKMLTDGIDLKIAKQEKWSHIPSFTQENPQIPKIGLIAWNYDKYAEPLNSKDMQKAGIIILIKDQRQQDTPGFDSAVRSGLIDSNTDSE